MLAGALAAAAALVAVAPTGTAAAAAGQPPGDAQRRLEAVQRELREVAEERRRIESARGEASRALREVEERVSASGRSLAGTEAALARDTAALAALSERRGALLRTHDAQRRELAALLRAADAQGPQAPLKLLLAQDRSAEAQRQLIYYGYLQRQRSARIAALSAELAELDRVEAAIQARRTALDNARAEQRRQRDALARDRAARDAVLVALEQRYRERSARERALGGDAKALQQLITRLQAAAARAAAQRAAAERAERQRAEAAARAAATSTGKAPPRPGERRPADGNAGKPPRTVARATPVQVGGLGWPLSGDLLAGYGARMPDGSASNGLLIGAAQGSPVRAVADGSVVFAEWMTGYGLILILDHGDGTMSLYAHSETLLKSVGDRVRRGDPVARVGNSGGASRPALYFELRRNGRPVDPRQWFGKR